LTRQVSIDQEQITVVLLNFLLDGVYFFLLNTRNGFCFDRPAFAVLLECFNLNFVGILFPIPKYIVSEGLLLFVVIGSFFLQVDG
jgi:hypothetical protein